MKIARTVVILVMSIPLIFSFTACGSSTKVNFHDLHDEYCDNLGDFAHVNKKGTTLSIIVLNETTTYSYNNYYEPAETAVKKINKALGFSDSLLDEMKKRQFIKMMQLRPMMIMELPLYGTMTGKVYPLYMKKRRVMIK